MNRLRHVWLIAAIVLACGLHHRTASAQAYTWLAGTSGTMTVAGNWVGGIAGAANSSSNAFANTTSLITGGTAILAGGSQVATGTLTIDSTGMVASGASNVSFLPFALTNNGTFRHGTSSIVTLTNTTSPIINNGVIETTGGGTLKLYTNAGTVSNTTGLISISSGTLDISRTTYTINGGTLSIGPGSTKITEVANTTTTLNNMLITNAGTISMNKLFAPGARVFSYRVQGTGTFNNSGVVSLTFGTLSGSTTTGDNTTSMTFSSGQSVVNTGTINVSQLYAQTSSTSTQPVFVSGSSSFTNQGWINIATSTSSIDTAQFRWSTALGNSGVMSADGPKSSIQIGSQTFTQTGAASVLSLANGGQIVAGSVVINSGTLLGTGTVSAPSTIGGILAPGDAGIGTLTAGGNVTWNAGNAWAFELGTPAVSLASASTGSSTQDLIAITGNFAKGSGSGFAFDFLQSGATGWYKVADWSGSTTFVAGDFTATNLPSGNTATFTVDNATSALYVEVVPEPGALVLAACGLVTVSLMARRRARRTA